MFLYNIIKFNTDLGRICFCFGGALGGIMMVLKESSTFVSCLHKQIPFVSILLEVREQSLRTRRYIGLYKGLYSS